MSQQKYSANTWVWYKKDGGWHHGTTAKMDCFNSETNTYKVHREGFYGRKPDNVAARDIRPYRVTRLTGKNIEYRHPKSGEWVEGIAYRPTSPSCTEYLVAPRDDPSRRHTIKVKKKDIRLR